VKGGGYLGCRSTLRWSSHARPPIHLGANGVQGSPRGLEASPKGSEGRVNRRAGERIGPGKPILTLHTRECLHSATCASSTDRALAACVLHMVVVVVVMVVGGGVEKLGGSVMHSQHRQT